MISNHNYSHKNSPISRSFLLYFIYSFLSNLWEEIIETIYSTKCLNWNHPNRRIWIIRWYIVDRLESAEVEAPGVVASIAAAWASFFWSRSSPSASMILHASLFLLLPACSSYAWEILGDLDPWLYRVYIDALCFGFSVDNSLDSITGFFFVWEEFVELKLTNDISHRRHRRTA